MSRGRLDSFRGSRWSEQEVKWTILCVTAKSSSFKWQFRHLRYRNSAHSFRSGATRLRMVTLDPLLKDNDSTAAAFSAPRIANLKLQPLSSHVEVTPAALWVAHCLVALSDPSWSPQLRHIINPRLTHNCAVNYLLGFEPTEHPKVSN